MSLLASAVDFEPQTAQEKASALYYDPNSDSGYKQYTFFQTRIDSLKGRFAPNNQKTAIWGCGWGYLVQLAVAAGYDAFGYDASAYAINKAKTLFPAISNRFFQRNALVSGDMTPSRRDAGLQGAQKFSILVTEDLLPCMSDTEISTAIPLLRGICSANLLHIVSPLDSTTTNDPRINWKSDADWKALLSPPDVAYDAFTDKVIT